MTSPPTPVYEPDAALEHGWSPATPLGDTILRRAVFALAESTARPSEVMGAAVVRTDDLIATHLGRPAGYWNAAVVLRPLERAGWEEVDGVLAGLDALSGVGGTVDLWSPFPTPDLAPRGWRLAGHPVAMWRPPAAPATIAPGDLRIERVQDADGIRAWAEAAVACYPLDADPAAIATAALSDAADVHLHLGRVAGAPVAVSATVVTHGTNAVPLVATSADARGRGYGEALTWAASLVRPDLPAVLLASDEGRSLYERMGYLPLARWTMWIRPDR